MEGEINETTKRIIMYRSTDDTVLCTQGLEMGIATLEHYIELGLLNDKELIAEIMEQTQCYDLLNVIKLFDMVAAEQIEDILRGV